MWYALLISISGHRYFLSFIDDSSRCTWGYVMKSWDELPSIFEDFHKLIENKVDAKIEVLRSDSGREYISNVFQNYVRAYGIEF